MGSRALRVHRREVEAGDLRPLQPWEMVLAEYLVQSNRGKANYEELHAFLSRQEPAVVVEDKALRKLLHRDESFKRYRNLYENDVLSAMRQRVLTHMPEFITAHVKGLRLAIDGGNPKDIATFTQPMVDRALPKKEEATSTVAVQVVLNARQLATLDVPTPEVEHEVIEAEIVE